MTHWACHPTQLQCVNGHAYHHPRNSGMSMYYGGGGAITVSFVCHRCNPVTYSFGVLYTVEPIPMCYLYGCPDQPAFNLVQQMDEDDIPLERIIKYLNEQRAA